MKTLILPSPECRLVLALFFFQSALFFLLFLGNSTFTSTLSSSLAISTKSTNIYPKTCKYYLLNLEPIANVIVCTTSVPRVQSCDTLQCISLVNSGLRALLLDVSCFGMKQKWTEAVLEQNGNFGHNFQQDVRCFGFFFKYCMEAMVNYCIFSPKNHF